MKILNIELEDELFEELEKICSKLEITKEKFIHEILKTKIIKKDNQISKINDREQLRENLQKINGEDEWI